VERCSEFSRLKWEDILETFVTVTSPKSKIIHKSLGDRAELSLNQSINNDKIMKVRVVYDRLPKRESDLLNTACTRYFIGHNISIIRIYYSGVLRARIIIECCLFAFIASSNRIPVHGRLNELNANNGLQKRTRVDEAARMCVCVLYSNSVSCSRII